MDNYILYVESQRRERLKKHVHFMMSFVKHYCRFLHVENRDHFAKSYFLLPNFFKDVVVKYVQKTLDDADLMELLSLVSNFPDRVDILLRGLAETYRNDFTNLKVIEWASMVCAVSTYLHDKGFKNALPLSIDTIYTVCNFYRRYEAFACLGCDV